VQRCKAERSSCGKVERWKYEKGAKRGTGDRKVSAGGARVVRSRFGRYLANGRDAVAPLPEGGVSDWGVILSFVICHDSGDIPK